MLVLEDRCLSSPTARDAFTSNLDALKALNFILPSANQFFAAPKGRRRPCNRRWKPRTSISWPRPQLNDAARGVRTRSTAPGSFSPSAIGRGQRASRWSPAWRSPPTSALRPRDPREDQRRLRRRDATRTTPRRRPASTSVSSPALHRRGRGLVIGATPATRYRSSVPQRLICYIGCCCRKSRPGTALLMQLTINQEAPQLRFIL